MANSQLPEPVLALELSRLLVQAVVVSAVQAACCLLLQPQVPALQAVLVLVLRRRRQLERIYRHYPGKI